MSFAAQLDARLAAWGQAQVFDVTLDAGWRYSRHVLRTPLSGTSVAHLGAGINQYVSLQAGRPPPVGRRPGTASSMRADAPERARASFSAPADAGCSAMRPSHGATTESGGHGCGGGAHHRKQRSGQVSTGVS